MISRLDGDVGRIIGLVKNLGEQNDIAAQHPEIVKKIKAIMKASRTETPWTTWKYKQPI